MNKKLKNKNTKNLKNKKEPIDNKILNGLWQAVLDQSSSGGSESVSQVDTLAKSTRNYLISNMRQLLSQIYVEHGLISAVVDVPVDDAFRGGVIIKSKQLSPDDLIELNAKIDKEKDLLHMATAMRWTRLFGGGALIVITEQPPASILNLDLIDSNSKLEFKPVDMWELYHTIAVDDERSLEPADDVEFFNYYGVKIHSSRVIKFKGQTAPSFLRPRLRGWGYSVVESFVRSINQYLKTSNLTFEVLDEFKLDVFKIKGLASTLLESGGTEKVQQRIGLANKQKNYQNAISMDAEDDYVQKQLAFSGLAEIISGLREQIASDLRIPITKLFGVSTSGFNSGESDIENYNAMVESTVRQKIKYDILKIVELRSKQLFNIIPDDIKIEFPPLRVLNAQEEEGVKTQKFTRLLQARQIGEISTEEFRDALNKNDLLGLQLDVDAAINESDNEDNQNIKGVQEV